MILKTFMFPVCLAYEQCKVIFPAYSPSEARFKGSPHSTPRLQPAGCGIRWPACPGVGSIRRTVANAVPKQRRPGSTIRWLQCELFSALGSLLQGLRAERGKNAPEITFPLSRHSATRAVHDGHLCIRRSKNAFKVWRSYIPLIPHHTATVAPNQPSRYQG